MPSYTEKQRRFMGAELSRMREGKETKTNMSEEQLREYAGKPLRKKHQRFSRGRKMSYGR